MRAVELRHAVSRLLFPVAKRPLATFGSSAIGYPLAKGGLARDVGCAVICLPRPPLKVDGLIHGRQATGSIASKSQVERGPSHGAWPEAGPGPLGTPAGPACAFFALTRGESRDCHGRSAGKTATKKWPPRPQMQIEGPCGEMPRGSKSLSRRWPAESNSRRRIGRRHSPGIAPNPLADRRQSWFDCQNALFSRLKSKLGN
jgi:hypothetical protein